MLIIARKLAPQDACPLQMFADSIQLHEMYSPAADERWSLLLQFSASASGFIAVAEELHFARAAERLHIEQSPLSRTIKELEYHLGLRLFDRTTRSTRLTWAGQVFLEDARRVFTTLEQARDNAKAAATGYLGTLRIAFSDDISSSRLATLLAQCRAEEPEVEIRLFPIPFLQQMKGLRGDLYDAGLPQSAEVGKDNIAEPVWIDPVDQVKLFTKRVNSDDRITPDPST